MSSLIPDPPKVICHYIKDVDGPPFLNLRHIKFKLEYPDGTISEEFVHDIVVRSKGDAAIIVAYDTALDIPMVWLRSCVRPAICIRDPLPNSNGCVWELPAGLVDEGEEPIEAGVRELYEEAGFKVSKELLKVLGRPIWGSVGISPERLFFYCVDVTGLTRHPPGEDGSPLERNGECVLVPLDAAMSVCDGIASLGLYRLKELFAE